MTSKQASGGAVVESLDMSTQRLTAPLPPPGLFASISSGFEAVARHIYVILLPVLLDGLLWLGPHVRVQALMQPIIASWATLSQEGLFEAEVLQQMQEIWSVAVARFNVLSLMNTFPIGVPSLIASIAPENTPLGRAPEWQVGSMGQFVLIYALVILSGFVLGAIYLRWVAHVTLHTQQNPLSLKNMTWSVVHACFIMLGYGVIYVILLVPTMIVLTLLALIDLGLAQFVAFLALFMFVGTLVPVYFSAHGVLVYGHNALLSFLQSIKLVRFTFPVSALFLIIMFVLYQGLSYLWRIPNESSWLLAVGILGHAYIGTALAAGGFIYYRDMNAWLQVMLDRLKIQTPSQSAQA